MFINIDSTNQTSFQGFAKFSGKPEKAEKVAQKVKEMLPDSFVFSDKKISNKKTFFILTGKHQDKFLDLFGSVGIWELKENIEKYIGQKAKILDMKAIEKMSKKELKKSI